MRAHILGICGTFMSGVAVLAKQSGYEVSGSDINVYPPMNLQLIKEGINVINHYEAKQIEKNMDSIIVGNVIKRGNPAIEYVLSNSLPYISGPQWLAEHILKNKWVLAVAGTHGKTTTASLLAWILECADLDPGFLIGGIPENFGVSARLGNSPYFVIEADEYDSAFFDKRSKFIHYHPKTIILNNLEYDHADIFPDLNAIKQQFHYLIRTIPNNGRIIRPFDDANIKEVLAKGCWTPVTTFGGDKGEWQANLIEKDGSVFTIKRNRHDIGTVRWQLLGVHNVNNALAAMAAAEHLNIPFDICIQALCTFKSVQRRLEVKAKVNDIVIYDDFAHHPSAIETTLAGLRAKIGDRARMIAVIEFGSYTMRCGIHKDKLPQALKQADMVICKSTEVDWGLKEMMKQFKQPTAIFGNVDEIVKHLLSNLVMGDHVVIMSNSGFDGIHHKLINALELPTQ